MGFTKDQQAVIDARDSNILVSAAAGSGKTTVMVERIIQKITEGQGTDIDRLLVVTFTKAAASQMKEKILAAIRQKLLEEPDNAHLQRQETLVHGAQITTIDSFCQYVIRNNFNEIGLDPSYRVGDEGEMELLRADVMEELLEDRYSEADPDFLECTEYFATGNNDKKLEGFILQLYDYAMSMPFPEEWLRDRGQDYEAAGMDFENAFFVKLCKKRTIDTLEECRLRLEQALKIAEDPDGPYYYSELLERELEAVSATLDKAVQGAAYDELRSSILNITFDRLPGKRDPSVNTDKRDEAQKHRNYEKEKITKLAKTYFAEDKETVLKHMQLAAKPVKTLSELAVSFKERFDEKKRERGIIDFGDMEHLALEILIKRDDEGNLIPTTTALQYRDYYDEVMIDEYQDSNSVQELILSSVSGEDDGRYNRFMVGDVKQSIYKFRLARPEIFMDKLGSYEGTEGAPRRKIILSSNFRSRREVLDSVNYIFEQIMGEDLGGVEYDEHAALRTGAVYPAADGDDFDTELMLVDKGENTSTKARELEARMTALRIEELMKNGRVTGDDGTMRSVRYSDIVILMRAVSGWDEVYRKALEDRGIPAYVESRTGYFSATEVVTVLNLLSILDNPLQDIPLVSVMHSPIGGFTDEELAIIRALDRRRDTGDISGGHFYDILKRSVAEDTETESSKIVSAADVDAPTSDLFTDELRSKIKDFLSLIDEYRDKSEYMPIDELISDIIYSTGYYEYCAALPGGTKRTANLAMLTEKAVDYEKTSYKGLFHFVRYIEQLSKYQVDYGEAGVLGEYADVVRIMSIHKSKGLEFPIVFLSGISRGFNFRDTNNAVVLDMDLGIGTHAIDLESRIKYRTLRKSIMDDIMRMDVLGEELRILYVGMTRAKEKLILTGQTLLSDKEKRPSDDLREELSDIMRYRGRDAAPGIQPYLLPYYARSGAGSYMDLILMALARHPDMASLAALTGAECEAVPDSDGCSFSAEASEPVRFAFRIYGEDDLSTGELTSDVEGSLRLKELYGDIPADTEKRAFYRDRFSESYRYEAYNRLFVKTTVSELKKASLIEESEPSFELFGDKSVQDKPSDGKAPSGGAERGTAYHRIMELLYEGGYDEYEKRISDLDGFIKGACKEGKLDEKAAESVDRADILQFTDSTLGKRMADAAGKGRLHRETPFMMGVPARRLDDTLPEDELVLVQGIIDVWFEEDDGIVLMDYKTDRVKSADDLIKRYRVQLDYYEEALFRITDKKVKERFIYSFTLGETIPV